MKTSTILSIISCETLPIILSDTKSTLVPEWVRMLVTSLSDESGSIGTATLPKATAEKKATVQFGIF